MSTKFRQQGSLQQINVKLLVKFCFLQINEKMLVVIAHQLTVVVFLLEIIIHFRRK